MKFLCGNCKAKYQIADEKVSGRTLRMKCRRCGHDILIDGQSMPQSQPPQQAAATSSSARRATSNSTVSVLPSSSRGQGSGAGPMPLPAPRGGAPLPGLRGPATRSRPPAGLSQDFRRHIAAPPEVPQRGAPYDLWHVAIQDVPVGPMTRDELARKIDAGAVGPDSLCWREGMDDWRPLGELPELMQLLRRPRSNRPPRSRVVPPVVPMPPPARPSSMFPSVQPDEYEDEGSEPTRIADLTGPQSAMLAAPAPSPAATSSAQSKVMAPISQGVPVSELPRAPATARPRDRMSGSTGMILGIAVTLALLGGPLLFARVFHSATPAEPAAQTAIVNAPEKPKTPEIAPQETQDVAAETEGKTPGKKPKTGPVAARPKVDPGAAKDSLTDEQRRLLERMGGGDGPDLGKYQQKDTAASAGPRGGELNADQVRRVVQQNRPQLTRCYESALRLAGGSAETIKVTVNAEVGGSGLVKSVTTEGRGLGGMTDCIRNSVKRWRFPPSSGDSPISFPVVFQPGA